MKITLEHHGKTITLSGEEFVERYHRFLLEERGERRSWVDTYTESLVVFLESLAVETKTQEVSGYEVNNRRPRWITRENGEIVGEEPYNHQDGNFSNLCAASFCRCQT